MGFFNKIYRNNIYSVIGTLVFHILLVSSFLLAEINMKGEMKEEPIIIEFPEELLKMEELTEKEQTEAEKVETTNDPSSKFNQPSPVTNRPANLSESARDKFFDKEYQREIESAKKLSTDVSKQLSKEIPDIQNIKMPEQVSEDGLDPASVKNKIYTGKSNIEYDLKNRYHIRLPVPVYLARGGGTIVVDIAVNQQGKVVSAKCRNNASVTDEQMCLYAQVAAQRTVFNTDLQAPGIQNGTIRYTFVAQ